MPQKIVCEAEPQVGAGQGKARFLAGAARGNRSLIGSRDRVGRRALCRHPLAGLAGGHEGCLGGIVFTGLGDDDSLRSLDGGGELGRPGGNDCRGAGEHLVIRKEGRCLPCFRRSGSERIGLGDLLGELLLGGLLGRGGGIGHTAGRVPRLDQRRQVTEHRSIGGEDRREPGLRLLGGSFERGECSFLLGAQARELIDERGEPCQGIGGERRRIDAPLIGAREGDAPEERPEMKAVRAERLGQVSEEVGVGRGVVGIEAVERVDEPAAVHRGPQPVGQSTAELEAVSEHPRERFPPTVERNAADVLRWGRGVLIGRFRKRLEREGSAERDARPDSLLAIFGEHRGELDLAVGLLAEERLRIPLRPEQARPREEGIEAVKVGLMDVGVIGMIVALGTLEIAAEEDPPDRAGHLHRLRLPGEKEGRGRAGRRIGAVGGEAVAADLIERAIGRQSRHEELAPSRRHVGGRSLPLQEHAIEEEREMPGVGRRGEELIDQPGALVGARVGQKRADAVDGGNRADEVDRDAAEKIGIGADRGQRADGIRFDD